MENPLPTRRHRLGWLALATLGTLLLLPATRYLLRSQTQMESLTYSIPADRAAERAVAARMPDDYPVQLALATDMRRSFHNSGLLPDPVTADSMAQEKARNRRIAALISRFPNNPSLYANLLRYMMMGEVLMQREDGDDRPPSSTRPIPYQPSPEAVEMFEDAARKGVQLDSDNAYFRLMQSIGLFNAHRDREALDALKAAGRCSRWTEYFQDELDGQNRLQVATYGEQGAVRRMSNAANLLLPEYTSLRAEARLVRYLAGNAERVGNTEEGLADRHALIRCGGLIRAQGGLYCTSLVGIAMTEIGMGDPGGIRYKRGNSNRNASETPQQSRARHLLAYCAYMKRIGHPEEAVWVRTEVSAGEQVKVIGTESIQNTEVRIRRFYQLGSCWLTNLVLLSSALLLLILGAAAHLAGAIRLKRARPMGRFAYALLILGGIGLWQWHAARAGLTPYFEIHNLFDGEDPGVDAANYGVEIQSLITGLSLLVPALFVSLIAGISLFQRVPLAIGVGRGLRGAAIPTAGVLFLLYAGSLLPTVHTESVLKADLARAIRNEPRYFAEYSHKVWPGDPQP